MASEGRVYVVQADDEFSRILENFTDTLVQPFTGFQNSRFLAPSEHKHRVHTEASNLQIILGMSVDGI